MTLIIIAIAILFFGLFVSFIVHGGQIESLQREVERLKQKMKFDSIRPQIQEYSDLKGYTDFSLHGDQVRFHIGMFNYFVSLRDIEKELSELKKVLERNCPKKCAKKKR